jgi:predicted enzyme related to lactoylglutathione lyase
MNKLVHWEIPTTNMPKTRAFYTKLFGWKTRGWSDDYLLFASGPRDGGAFMQVKKMPRPGIRVYISVKDVAAALKKVEKLGGKTAQPKTEIGRGMGFAGSFLDPCGCLIGLWSKK